MTQSSDRSAAAAGYGDSFADVYDAWYSDDASGSTSGDVAGVVALSRRFSSGDVLELVELTGGQSFAATDLESLKAIFTHIDRMKPARFAPAGTVQLNEPVSAIALAIGVHEVPPSSE